ncbi:MAG: hypothetical protein ABL929_12440 [Ferruginibacter sp.]
MKKIKFILIIVAFIQSSNLNAQTPPPVTDTLAYLQNIVNNKALYIGQPFSVLLNTLSIQIKFFSPFAAIHYDKNKETSTSFSFYFPQNYEEVYLTYPKLEIYWQPYLNRVQSDIFWESNNGGGWSPIIGNYYGAGIIADIKVIE